MSDHANLEVIVRDLQKAPTTDHYNAVLKSAYASGWTLKQLGDATGVTREAIRLRLIRSVDPALLGTYMPPQKAVARQRRDLNARAKQSGRKRILGLKVTSPVMQIPVETLNRLTQLQELTSQVRGHTPLDAPERLAIEPFGQLLSETYDTYEIPETHLEAVCGLSPRTLVGWLRRHGYRAQYSSQRNYRGIYRGRETEA